MVRQPHTLLRRHLSGFTNANVSGFFFFCLMPPADNLTVNEQLTGPHAAGVNSILPKEHGSQFFYLPIIRHSDEEVSNNTHFTALSWLKRELIITLKKKCKTRKLKYRFKFFLLWFLWATQRLYGGPRLPKQTNKKSNASK